MMQQQVVWIGCIHKLPVIPSQGLQAGIGRLDEDVRLVACASKYTLYPQHFVADGIAIAERGENLVNSGPWTHRAAPGPWPGDRRPPRCGRRPPWDEGRPCD